MRDGGVGADLAGIRGKQTNRISAFISHQVKAVWIGMRSRPRVQTIVRLPIQYSDATANDVPQTFIVSRDTASVAIRPPMAQGDVTWCRRGVSGGRQPPLAAGGRVYRIGGDAWRRGRGRWADVLVRGEHIMCTYCIRLKGHYSTYYMSVDPYCTPANDFYFTLMTFTRI